MTPQTVLHLINTGGPGGAETVCVNLVRGLDRQRWRPILAMPHPDWMSEVLAGLGIETIFIEDASVSAMPGYLRGLSRIISERNVKLIHAHLLGPSIAASALGLARRLPVVATVHGMGDLRPTERFRRIKFFLLNHGANRIIFVSEALRQSFLATGLLRENITAVIPNGVDLHVQSTADRSTIRAELGVRENEFLVGAVGNFRRAKAYDVLLRAAALLKARAPNYRFVIIGQLVEQGSDGSLVNSLMQVRNELQLQEQVIFAGFRSDVRSALSAFDLFTLTSSSEGFSISLVEAMASGLPVVATRCGGPETILDDGITGVLVANGSPHAVADAIDALRKAPNRRRTMGAAAQSAAREQFSLDTHIAAYEALYDRCIAERTSRGRN